jgi:putative Holliday junction resolvase
MKILAIDYGDKNLGIALSDKTQTIAIPFSVEKNDDRFSEKLLKIVKNKKIIKIIAGLPLTLKGEEGQQAKKTKKYFEILSKQIKMDIELVDERFSTRQSKERLEELKKCSHKDIDKYSAAIILENYLKKKR